MKSRRLSRLCSSTRCIKRSYRSETSMPPAAVSSLSFSSAGRIGLPRAIRSPGSSEKLSANIFMSSYTRVSSPFSFAKEKRAFAYRDEIVPISIRYDLQNDTSSNSRSMICCCSLSWLIFSFITFFNQFIHTYPKQTT